MKFLGLPTGLILSLCLGGSLAMAADVSKFPADQINSVEITKLTGKVYIEVTSQTEASVEKIGNNCPIEIGLTQNKLTIKEIAPKGSNNCNGTIKVSIPATANINVDAQAADVYANGLKGNAHFEISSGDLTVKNAQSNLTAKLGSGNIDLVKFAGQTKVQLMSGNAHISFVKADTNGPTTVKTMSGDVEIDLPQDFNQGPITASSVAGNVKIKAPAKLAIKADLHSLTGKIKNEFPEGPVANALEISAKTTAGNIKIEKK